MQGGRILVASAALMFAVAIVAIESPAFAQTQPSAAERLNTPGPEAESLARMVGDSDVVMTFQASPDAPATEIKGLVAHREMIGSHLQQIMQPERNSQVQDFRRISYLLFNRVEGRWQYVSLDTRFPVGIMPAESFDAGEDRDRTAASKRSRCSSGIVRRIGLTPTSFSEANSSLVSKTLCRC